MTVTLTRTGAAVHNPCYVEWCQLPNDHDSIHWHVDYPGKPPTEPPLIPKVEAARRLEPDNWSIPWQWFKVLHLGGDSPYRSTAVLAIGLSSALIMFSLAISFPPTAILGLIFLLMAIAAVAIQ